MALLQWCYLFQMLNLHVHYNALGVFVYDGANEFSQRKLRMVESNRLKILNWNRAFMD